MCIVVVEREVSLDIYSTLRLSILVTSNIIIITIIITLSFIITYHVIFFYRMSINIMLKRESKKKRFIFRVYGSILFNLYFIFWLNPNFIWMEIKLTVVRGEEEEVWVCLCGYNVTKTKNRKNRVEGDWDLHLKSFYRLPSSS